MGITFFINQGPQGPNSSSGVMSRTIQTCAPCPWANKTWLGLLYDNSLQPYARLAMCVYWRWWSR